MRLSAIPGSGPGGSVTSEDVIVAVARRSAEGGDLTVSVTAGAHLNGTALTPQPGPVERVDAPPPAPIEGSATTQPGPAESAATAQTGPVERAAPLERWLAQRAAAREPGPTQPDTDAELAHAGQPDKNGDKPMSRQDELARLITDVRRSIPELNGIMIASVDGLAIAHDFPDAEAERIAAMAATALGLGKRTTERTNLGELMETVIRGDRGYLVVYAAGDNAVLVLQGPMNANLGLMRIEARAASAQISQSLR